MNEQNKSPGQLAYEFLSSLSSNPLFKWSSLDPQWQQSWEQTAAFMAGKTTQAPVPEDKWAKEREHFTNGGRIQFDVGDGTWRDWRPTEAPAFPNSWAWRIHPEDIKPDNCPTCGSSSIAIKMIGDDPVIQGGEHGSCPDAFHTFAAAAQPAPITLKVGDSVKVLADSTFSEITKERDGWFKIKDGRWFSAATLMVLSKVPAPEPWRPKYHAGQAVQIKGESKRELILVPFENTQNYKLQGRNEFFNEDELEPYVWIMPTPPVGHSWRMKYPWPTSRDQVNLAR